MSGGVTIFINIRIKANQYIDCAGYCGSQLSLPANKNDMLDALDKANVPYGSGEYTIAIDFCFQKYLADILANPSCNPSLYEVNYLVEQLNRMDSHELCVYEGVVAQSACKSAANLINATFNLGKYSFYSGFTTDKQLGEHVIENEIFPELSQMSDEMISCLDFEKLGAMLREEDGGFLTQRGYIVPEAFELDNCYDESLAIRPVTLCKRDPIISVLIACDEVEGNEVWLHLPASDEDISHTLDSLNVSSLDECVVLNAQCVIPAFSYGLDYNSEINLINDLAIAIKENCIENLAKYKAVCGIEQVKEVGHAIRLAKQMDEYTLTPLHRPENARGSVYGFISRDRQPEQELAELISGLESEQEQAFETTM